MHLRYSPLLTAAILAACASQPATTTPAPARAPAATPAPAPPAPAPEPAEPAPREIPKDWHLRDAAADSFPGISLLKAERELLQGRQPARTVVVAVIDNGVDTAHAALRTRLWSA
jgi:hypothetical protein